MKKLAFYMSMLVLWCGIEGCRPKIKAVNFPFQIPKIPLRYTLLDSELPVHSTDTVYRVDSLGQQMYVEISLINKQAAKLWRIDTMHFVSKNRLANWEHQKRGFYWLFQGISVSGGSIRNQTGIETAVYDRYKVYFMFSPVYQPARGEKYPFIDYKVMDEYWSPLHADVIGVSNPRDGEVFVLAHPIKKRIRQKDLYRMVNATDSVPIPYYSDQIDSTRMVCMRIAVFQLNLPHKNH